MGCAFILIFSIMMGSFIAFAVLHVAVWLYAICAIVSFVVLAIVYGVLTSKGIFERASATEGLRHTVGIVAQWVLRLLMLFLALTAAGAIIAAGMFDL